VREWLQLFRAQTAPATLMLVLVPFLAGGVDIGRALVLGFTAIAIHYISFGHNSLMDSCTVPKIGALPYDAQDPNKQHHPLIRGTISLRTAKRVILWAYLGLAAFLVFLTMAWSREESLALASLVMFLVGGFAYNEGLDKEDLLGFVPITVCFTSLAAWAWFMGHDELGEVGGLYLLYVMLTILYQISWSGHLKELGVKERSNLLIRLGASLKRGFFRPGWSAGWGVTIKACGIITGIALVLTNMTPGRVLWAVSMLWLMVVLLVEQVVSRPYVRSRELLTMSLMEIVTIYMPIPILISWNAAIILMLIGLLYFFGMNRLLWRAMHPGV
jgi:hypothetical protein